MSFDQRSKICQGLTRNQDDLRSMADHMTFMLQQLPAGKSTVELNDAIRLLRRADMCIEIAKNSL